jgi:hypothetical protein
MTGKWPTGSIVGFNTDKRDDRWSNLTQVRKHPATGMADKEHSGKRVTQTRLKQLFFYSEDTGNFMRLKTVSTRAKTGDIAGSLHTQGHLQFNVDGKSYKAHQLAWLYMTGEWPIGAIKHVNGDSADNSWSNLKYRSDKDTIKAAQKAAAKAADPQVPCFL